MSEAVCEPSRGDARAFDIVEGCCDLMSGPMRDALLLEGILALQEDARRRLLMFVHLAEHPEEVASEASVSPDGSVEVRLFYRAE